MDRTTFAGLTALEPGDALESDGAGFLYRNIHALDHLGQVGTVTHRHDEHAALPNPTASAYVTTASGGSIGNDVTLWVGYTRVDGDGGETLVSPLASATTPDSLDDPTSSPSVEFFSNAGSLIPGTYYYAVTLVDASGGESLLSEYGMATRPVGPASGQMVVGDLDDLMAEVPGAVSWRLFRSFNGGGWGLLATGTAAFYADTGAVVADATIVPPDVNGTGGNHKFRVVVPPQASGSAIRLYASQDPDLTSPAYVGAYAASGVTVTITALNFDTGTPPPVSLALPGAYKIDALTDIENLSWLAPVDTYADLPDPDNDPVTPGDVHLVLDTGTPYYLGDDYAWHSMGGGGGGLPWYPELANNDGASTWGLYPSGRLRLNNLATNPEDEEKFSALVSPYPPGIFLYDPWDEVWRRQDKSPFFSVSSFAAYNQVGLLEDHSLGASAKYVYAGGFPTNNAYLVGNGASGTLHSLWTVDPVFGAQQSIEVSTGAGILEASGGLLPSGAIGVISRINTGINRMLQAEYNLASRVLRVGIADATTREFVDATASGALEGAIPTFDQRYLNLRVFGDRAVATVQKSDAGYGGIQDPFVVGAAAYTIPPDLLSALAPNGKDEIGQKIGVFYREGTASGALAVFNLEASP